MPVLRALCFDVVTRVKADVQLLKCNSSSNNYKTNQSRASKMKDHSAYRHRFLQLRQERPNQNQTEIHPSPGRRQQGNYMAVHKKDAYVCVGWQR